MGKIDCYFLRHTGRVFILYKNNGVRILSQEEKNLGEGSERSTNGIMPSDGFQNTNT